MTKYTGDYVCSRGRNISLKFTNLTVWSRPEVSWWRRKIIKKSFHLLNNISGSIKDGDFVAVLGPSGSGKTTFLVSLAGKCTLPMQGSVSLNDTDVKRVRPGTVEIVPQFEVFVDSLSVLEHLHFMVEFKLGNNTKSIKNRILINILAQLKLKSHTSTAIRDLSGGERRLLSLASSLITNPKIIICDEPTTGLDSYNAALVVGVLKELAHRGALVICSVHQPSSDIYNEFNSIILLAEGKLLFHGSQAKCKELFERVQLICPKTYNPAEFYVRAISSDSKVNSSCVEKILMARRNLFFDALESGSNDHVETHSEDNPIIISKRNWFMQVYLLVWRSSLTVRRNIKRHLFELLTGALISAVIVGTCYSGISGTSQQGIQDVRGLLWLITSEVAFSIGYTSLFAFEIDLTVFKREAGMYYTSAYYMSRVICLVPKCIIWPVVSVIAAIMTVTFPNQTTTAASMTLALIGTGLASASYGLSIGALFTSSHLSNEMMPFLDTLLVLMSGTFLRISTIPTWLHGFKYISHFYYGMDAISNIYWKQIDVINCNWNTTNCIHDGVTVLEENGYSSNFILEDSLGFILIIVGWSFVGYMGLWREMRKGYAY